jgi:hypothetical protein
MGVKKIKARFVPVSHVGGPFPPDGPDAAIDLTVMDEGLGFELYSPGSPAALDATLRKPHFVPYVCPWSNVAWIIGENGKPLLGLRGVPDEDAE